MEYFDPDTESCLDVLREHDVPPPDKSELPQVGKIEDGEEILPLHPEEVGLGHGEIAPPASEYDPLVEELWGDIERILDMPEWQKEEERSRIFPEVTDEVSGWRPEPHCAWYQPIHYYSHAWGIYVREQCVISLIRKIPLFIKGKPPLPPCQIIHELKMSAFYLLYLHEEFHHKVESFGFRLLIAAGRDHYLRYKRNVYRANYLTNNCLEESLANANSYVRLAHNPYRDVVSDGSIRKGVRAYLKRSFQSQAPGYRQASLYLTDRDFKYGCRNLQSQIRDGAFHAPHPAAPHDKWLLAPDMLTALKKVSDRIYRIVPRGGRSIFSPFP